MVKTYIKLVMVEVEVQVSKCIGPPIKNAESSVKVWGKCETMHVRVV